MGTRRSKRIDGDPGAGPGRIAVDSRGRNVWQWNDDQLDSTTIMLQSLDNPELALEPTRKVRRIEAGDADSKSPARRRGSSLHAQDASRSLRVEQTFKVKIGGGFDPYNSS